MPEQFPLQLMVGTIRWVQPVSLRHSVAVFNFYLAEMIPNFDILSNNLW
jgi:hypothetical protein